MDAGPDISGMMGFLVLFLLFALFYINPSLFLFLGMSLFFFAAVPMGSNNPEQAIPHSFLQHVPPVLPPEWLSYLPWSSEDPAASSRSHPAR